MRPQPPAGGGERHPNYITPEGARRLQDELAALRSRDRPKMVQEVSDAAAQGDRSENAEYIYGKRKLREIDRRIQFLTKRLEAAVVVDPKQRAGEERVFFGATIEVEDEDGETARYQIVGEDEIDLTRGRISWRSPLGRALLNKCAGDAVAFRRPPPRPGSLEAAAAKARGLSPDVELQIVSVVYA